MRLPVTVYVLFVVLFMAPGLSSAQIVFAANYDVVLTAGDAQYRAQSRARVADGHVIPIEFQRFKVNLVVASIDAEKFQTTVNVFERIDGEWLQLQAGPGKFGGRFGAPLRYSWNGEGIGLDIAFICSIDRP